MTKKNKKITFIQTIPLELLGIQSLVAVLKNHEVQILIYYIDSYKTVLKKLREFNPDIICYSCCTGDHFILLQLAEKLKEEFEVPFIWGGPHATFFPEIINKKGVDIVVRGEAEQILPKIIDNTEDTYIKSCLFKKQDGTIITNEMGRLIDNLDSLPFPNRSIYRKYYKTLPYSSLNIVAGRGCPFNCSFCYNQLLKKMYNTDFATGKYIRLRSPLNVITEIQEYIKLYGKPKYIHFRDDTLIFNRKWLEEFLNLYSKHINIPYTCLGRADLIDEKLAELMKKTGIAIFFFAVETGNNKLRNEILNKNILNEKIVRCGDILNKYKIVFRVYNMMGLPTETLENALETVQINQQIKNPYPLSTVYDPYPGTELARITKEKNLFKPGVDIYGLSKNQYGESPVKGDVRTLRVQKIFFFFVKFPSLGKFFRKWIEKDHSIINAILFYAGYGYVFYKTYKYTITEMFLIFSRSFIHLAGHKKKQLLK